AAVASALAATSTWMPVESMNGTPQRSTSMRGVRRPSISARSGAARDGAVNKSISPTTVTTAGSPSATSTESSPTASLRERYGDPADQPVRRRLDVGRDGGDDPQAVTGLGQHVGRGRMVVHRRVADRDDALGAVDVDLNV